MDSTDKSTFEILWNNFTSRLKVKLTDAAQKDNLDHSYANLLLNEAAATWFTANEPNGKWLLDFKGKDAGKAQEVYEVLGNMHFKELDASTMESASEISPAYDYVIPTIGALIGWVISFFCGGIPVIIIISTLAPAGVLYPIARKWRLKRSGINKDKAADAYVAQLDKYYQKVDAILS